LYQVLTELDISVMKPKLGLGRAPEKNGTVMVPAGLEQLEAVPFSFVPQMV